MYVLELLGFSMLINVGMVTANTGYCPLLPRVPERDRTCFEEPNCFYDSDCKNTQKCCENSCGITRCFDIDPDPLEKIEKCPIIAQKDDRCASVRTKFCYIKNCQRCCHHKTACNPAKGLLMEAKYCNKEICANHKCAQQGAECYVGEISNKPSCRCITRCSKRRKYICAMDGTNPRTFINNCYMKKEACDKEKTYRLLYNESCRAPEKKEEPVQSPTVENEVKYANIGDSINVNCYGDNKKVSLFWVQKRADGNEIKLHRSFLDHEGVYSIKGKKRKVITLSISNVGPGSFGVYACKQLYDGSVLEQKLYLKPRKEVIFDRSHCNKTLAVGSCNGNFTNYYYDSKVKRCREFSYKGCSGNENNFHTIHDCLVRCHGITPKNISTALTNFDELCGENKCKFYERCIQKNEKFTCACTNVCSLTPDPVCASNGKTFLSLCAMKVEACRWRKPLAAIYTGKCGPNNNQDNKVSMPTKTTNLPVSLCKLKPCPPYSKCFVHPFTNLPQCFCQRTCAFKPKLVCASNMRHYLNECFMRVDSCKQNRKLTVLKRGLCIFNNQGT